MHLVGLAAACISAALLTLFISVLPLERDLSNLMGDHTGSAMSALAHWLQIRVMN